MSAWEKDVEAGVPGREEILGRARGLAPALRARAEAARGLRRVPDETMADYDRLGFIRLAQPRRYGGFELGWDVLCEVTEILAAADGSQAWIARIMADHAQMVATFPGEAQEEVWGDNPFAHVSAAFDPVGRAHPVDGGFRFSGRHGFSSGIDHAQWLICGGYIVRGDDLDGPHFFLVPKTDVTVIDDWHTIGLEGTGSKSFEARDVFVPAYRRLDGARARIGQGPGSAINTAPVYRTPRGGITSTGFAALAVGMARGVLAEWLAYTAPRKSRGMAVADQPGTQVLAARASAEIDAAGALYLGTIQRAMAVLEARRHAHRTRPRHLAAQRGVRVQAGAQGGHPPVQRRRRARALCRQRRSSASTATCSAPPPTTASSGIPPQWDTEKDCFPNRAPRVTPFRWLASPRELV